MLEYKNITLIGTSHISKDSIKAINKGFEKINPDIIAIELDKKRLHALLMNKKPDTSLRVIGQIGLTGYLFSIIGNFVQKKLGNIVGVKPGSDMLEGVKIAKKHQKKVALIDQDIAHTMRRLSKEVKFKDKFNIFIDIVRSPFSKKIQFDISKLPEKKLINEMMEMMKKKIPWNVQSISSRKKRDNGKKTFNTIKK
jgi:pheromone shutdown protein TraB